MRTGFSYIEMTLVVAILGVVALAVFPSLTTTDLYKLELAAEHVAEAIRFARSRSIATGEHFGVDVNPTTQIVDVFKADMTTTPVSKGSTERDPLTKQPYTFNLNTAHATDGVVIANSSAPFLYTDTQRRNTLLFDANGTPLWHVASSGVTSQLSDGTIQLKYGDEMALVSVAPYSGKVTIQ